MIPLWLVCALLAAAPAGLRCEHRVDPVGVDVARPRLSWELRDERRGALQTASQLEVSRRGTVVWDSGRVDGDACVAVPYAGPALEPVTRYAWRVRVWDQAGQVTPRSEPATFLTGKLKREDWRGQWIGASVGRADTALGLAVEARSADETHWVQIDLGRSVALERLVLHPMRHNDPSAGGWVDGYGFPVRFKLSVASQPDAADAVVVADQTGADYPNPGWRPVAFAAGGRVGRYVRLTVTRLWRRGPRLPFVYTLGELETFADGRNVALGRPVTSSASVEGYGWGQAQLTDGKALAASDTGASLTQPHGALYLRREVLVERPVVQATVCFSGLGFSELAIDGRKVGDYAVGPGFTTYDKRVQYLTFDVTDRFAAPGRRTLDATLVDGWYGLERDPWVHQFERRPYVDRPKLLLDLHLRHADGTEQVVSSDASWRWSEGEITRSWIPLEDVDLRRTGRDWHPVAVVEGPRGVLVNQVEPFSRVVDEFRPPPPVWNAATHTAVWELGHELAGWVRLRAAGPAGTELAITTIPTEPRPRTSRCVLAGTGAKEVYEPRFCYAGMRRVEVKGLVEPPAPDDLVVRQLSSLATPAGDFHCSDDWQNWLHDCVRRTAVAYTNWLPNDPVREWKAWTQDIETMFRSSVHLFDSPGLYERWQHDLLDGQRADGNCPNIAPGPFYDAYNSPWWGGCVVWLPWQFYLYYGDRTLLVDSYPAMCRYVDYLGQAATNGLQDWGLLDWLPVEETPRPLINTPAHYLFARVVAQTATLLRKPDDARRYQGVAEQVRATFNERYLDAATGIYGVPGWQPRSGNWTPSEPLGKSHRVWWTGPRPCTQAGQVLPLALGLVPEASRAAVEQALLAECAAHRDHLSTGFVSTPYLLDVLADLSPQTAWRMTSAREFPSWWSMTRGSGNDLLKETWAGGMALMPSLGGSVACWQTEALAGLRPDPDGPGFQRSLIRPQPAGDLRSAEAWHATPYGRLAVAWRSAAARFELDLTVPPNTSATLWLPAFDLPHETESGVSAASAPGVRFLRRAGTASVYAVSAGSYHFVSSQIAN